jgi:hypothetical protein
MHGHHYIKNGQQDINLHIVLVTLGAVFRKSKKIREIGVSDGWKLY